MNGEQDRALLRRFEPILRFTQGELFFPMDVEPYVRSCGLWVQRPGEIPMRLVSEGELTLSKLAQPRAGGQNAVYFFKFIEPMNLAEMAAYQIQRRIWRREALEEFQPGRGRLARVGYMSRLLDAIFSLTLLARGRVPGDTATAAVIEYRDILAEREHYAYHARVVRQNGWIVLQYWFFYPFNNWRSGFYGASDHEADWEMVNLYLSETEDGQVCPEWVAYAAHDYLGDDLRRRWDDPELDKAGEHPVVYVAAGSHASYFAPGEYLDEMELPFLSPLARVLDEMKEFFRRTLNRNQNRTEEPQRGANGLNIFRIPFVDYARGDGFAIGPGQARGWDEPRLLNPTPAWVYEYRGLWGLYARDPISGENAPAGPMYNRDGSVRRAWYDPLGWAGLDKLPPPDEAVERLRERQLELNARRIEMAEQIARKSEELTGLGIEAEAMRDFPHLKSRYLAHRGRVAALSEELKRMRAQLASDVALLEAIEFKIRSLLAGERGPARAHIRRPRQPASYEELRFSRLAETWAAISIGLVMIGFVVLVFLLRQNPILGLAAVLALMIFIESSFRGRLAGLVAGVTGLLAVVSALVILYEFFWQIVAAIVVLAGSYIVWENVREL